MAYVFDPDALREIAKLGRALPLRERLTVITQALAQRYPGKISEEPDWIFSSAGGVFGQFTILHASLVEYLIFFGSPIGGAGFTGRYRFVKDWAFLLDGEMRYFQQGQIDRDSYRAGDEIILEPGSARGYCIPDHAWILEYARGPIITMLPFGLANSLFSSLDLQTVFRTLRLYTVHIRRNWSRKKDRAV